MDDRENKGRNKPQKGEKNGRAKLSESDVFEMRRKREQGVSFQKIADEFTGIKDWFISEEISIPQALMIYREKEDSDENA